MGGWLEKLDEWINKHRPTALLAVVVLTVGVVSFLNWITASDLFQQLFEPKRTTVADVRYWSALVYALAFAMGLPVAFLLWHWRDRNVRDQIENARKDINLKEFQDVQLRAAGALDIDLPNEARAQLQIAALHQLRGFLRGEYGRSFRRPAFELLISGHAQAVQRINLKDEIEKISSQKMDVAKKMARSLEKCKTFLNDVDLARISIFREELFYILNNGFSLTNRSFDLIDFGTSFDGFDIDISIFDTKFCGSSFIGSSLRGVSAINCDFDGCDFYAADLSFSVLQNSRFWGAKMEGVSLVEADISGANLATIDPFDLSSCTYAELNENTWLCPAWNSVERDVRQKAQQAWIERDAILFSD